MFTLTVERSDGERLTLTQYASAYKVTYTGLDAVAAEIRTSPRGMTDGERYNGSRVGSRNIVLMVYITTNVENNRIRLYRFFAPKSWVKLYYKNGERDVYIEGYVESHKCNQFEIPVYSQISIICPHPYLNGAETVVQEITNVLSLFEFPFETESESGIEFSCIDAGGYAQVVNDGDVEAGCIIRVYASKEVSGIRIYNAVTGAYMRISGTLQAGELLTINTSPGSKRLTVTDADGVTSNALQRLETGSTWLQMAIGDNYIAYTADSGETAMTVSVEYNNLYVGV